MTKTPSPKRKTTKIDAPLKGDVCFTIMPFGGWFDAYYETIYKPAIIEAGLIPHRADDIYRPSIIVNDIWVYTQASKVILADLSDKNPNVFYELGLAHALAKPAIMVTQSMEDVPFDLRSLRIIQYDKNKPNWGDELKRTIKQALIDTIAAPVEAVLPAFLSVKTGTKTPAVSEQEKQYLELKREIDLIRNEMVASRPLIHLPPDTMPRGDSDRSVYNFWKTTVRKPYNPIENSDDSPLLKEMKLRIQDQLNNEFTALDHKKNQKAEK